MYCRGTQAMASIQCQPITGNFRPIRGLINPYRLSSGAAARVLYSRPHNAGPRLQSQMSSRRIAAVGLCLAFPYKSWNSDVEEIRAEKEEEQGKARIFGPWDQDDVEVEDDGDIYGSFKTTQEFRHFCRKKSVQPLFEHVGCIGEFGYLDAKYLAGMECMPEEATYHDEVEYVLDCFNDAGDERDGVLVYPKRILHLHYLNYCAFMKIEVLNLAKCGEVLTYNVAIWNKDFNGHSEIGLFKRVPTWTPPVTENS